MVDDDYPYDDYGVDYDSDAEERPPDPAQESAESKLRALFEERSEEVFFSRQLEVQNEDEFFHWITNRALRDLASTGVVFSETRELKTGGTIKLFWHRGYRYYKRSAKRLVDLVEEYADPNIGGAIGLHGELVVLEGFAGFQFVMRGRDTKVHRDKRWERSGHDLDFIFEKDSVAYGVEVKNTLSYMEYGEFQTKIKMCAELGLKPVFVVRMMPRTWIYELQQVGGFALIFKYQLYPWSHKELAGRVATELGLPVDAPRALQKGTVARFVKWHEKTKGQAVGSMQVVVI